LEQKQTCGKIISSEESAAADAMLTASSPIEVR